MRKSILFVLILCVFSSILYADELEKTVETRMIENLYLQENVEAYCLSYWYPLYKEAKFVYKIKLNQYNEKDCIASIAWILRDFTEERGYYHYRYLSDVETKYRKENNERFVIKYIHVKLY